MNALEDDSTTGSPDPVAIAAQLIAQLEGFSETAYPDPSDQSELYSIGYGHQLRNGDGFDTNSRISEPDAMALLQADLSDVVRYVNNAVTVQLAPEQWAALYSFTYNVGSDALHQSHLLQYVNARNFMGAQKEFSKWIYVHKVVNDGLVDRRQKEGDLFAAGMSSDGTDGSQVA